MAPRALLSERLLVPTPSLSVTSSAFSASFSLVFLPLSSSLPGHHGAASRKGGIHQENRQTAGAWHTRTSQTQKHGKRNARRQQGLPPRMLLPLPRVPWHFSLSVGALRCLLRAFLFQHVNVTSVYIQTSTASHTRFRAHTCPCVRCGE